MMEEEEAKAIWPPSRPVGRQLHRRRRGHPAASLRREGARREQPQHLLHIHKCHRKRRRPQAHPSLRRRPRHQIRGLAHTLQEAHYIEVVRI